MRSAREIVDDVFETFAIEHMTYHLPAERGTPMARQMGDGDIEIELGPHWKGAGDHCYTQHLNVSIGRTGRVHFGNTEVYDTRTDNGEPTAYTQHSIDSKWANNVSRSPVGY